MVWLTYIFWKWWVGDCCHKKWFCQRKGGNGREYTHFQSWTRRDHLDSSFSLIWGAHFIFRSVLMLCYFLLVCCSVSGLLLCGKMRCEIFKVAFIKSCSQEPKLLKTGIKGGKDLPFQVVVLCQCSWSWVIQRCGWSCEIQQRPR